MERTIRRFLERLFSEIYEAIFLFSGNHGITIVLFTFILAILINVLLAGKNKSAKEAYFSLFLRVVFLMGSYHMFRHYDAIRGVSFLFIADLGAPDGLLFGINLTPVLMLLSGIASIYATCGSCREKKETALEWVFAIISFTALYTSPAALSLFWTFYNIWKILVKNYFPKIMARLSGSFLCCSNGIDIKIWQVLIANFFVFLLVTFPNLHQRFATDSYTVVFNENLFIACLVLGRPTAGIILEILHTLNINIIHSQSFLFLFYALSFAVCSYLIMQILKSLAGTLTLKTAILVNFSMLYAFVNPNIQEIFQFVELNSYISLGLIVTVISVRAFFSANKPLTAFILSSVWLFVAVGTYQALISVYIIFVLTFLLIKHKFQFRRAFFREIIIFICVCLVATLANVLTMKFAPYAGIAGANPRGFTVSHIFEHLKILFNHTQWYLWKGFTGASSRRIGGPHNAILGFILVMSLLYSFRRAEKRRTLYGLVFLVLFMAYCGVFAVHLFSGILAPWPRTLIGFYFLIPAICILITQVDTGKPIPKIVYGAVFFFFIVNMYQTQGMSINQYANNRIDMEYARAIYSEILDYENSSGNEIRNIMFFGDGHPTRTYKDIEYAYADINVRALIVSWSIIPLINYVSGRSFTGSMDQELLDTLFDGKNWDRFIPKEQLHFQDDTLYLALY